MGVYKIRIVVAESRPVVMSGLQHWFGVHERFDLAAFAGDGARLLDALKSAECDLIVLSGGIEGSGGDDFALLRALRHEWPDTPVVVFTHERDAAALAAMQRAGASGLASVFDEARAFERVCERVLSGAKHVVSARIAACSQPAAPQPDADVCADSHSDAAASPDYGTTRMNIRQFVGRT
ncbi:response regulator [Caballeronia peredens]|nr:response regulator [Caballeronia peredens]